MGTKRVGLARTQALVENLKRELTMGTSVFRGRGFQAVSTAVTAAAAGADIPAGASHVTVTSGNAAHWVNLPSPVVGNIINVFVGSNGCELRTSAPASIAINGGSGAGAESALPANSYSVMICTSATTWIGFEVSSVGAVSAVEVAS
jgi:hypothetical protein